MAKTVYGNVRGQDNGTNVYKVELHHLNTKGTMDKGWDIGTLK